MTFYLVARNNHEHAAKSSRRSRRSRPQGNIECAPIYPLSAGQTLRRERGRRRREESGGCLAVILFNVNFRCAHVALGKLLVSFFMTRLISSLFRKNIDINIFECVCVCICSLSLLLSFFWLPTTFDNVNSIEHSRKPTRAAILFVVLVVVVVALNFHLLYIFLYISLCVCVYACGSLLCPLAAFVAASSLSICRKCSKHHLIDVETTELPAFPSLPLPLLSLFLPLFSLSVPLFPSVPLAALDTCRMSLSF